MAEVEGAPMSRQEFSVAYDGSARGGDHSIDVQALATALMAFGKLLREANFEFNGKKVTTKVLVVSDFEHKCFNINFELIVGLYEQVKQLLGLDETKTAKEILEWIGLLKEPAITGGAVATGQVSFLKFLQWRKGREITEERTDINPSGLITVIVKGDHNNVTVAPEVLSLAKNIRALRATQNAFIPLGQDGFDTMRVSGSDTLVSESFSPNDVNDIVASCTRGIEDSKEIQEPDIEETPAWLSVYSPVYDLKADRWRFRLGRDTIYADISETFIAQEALSRGGALSEDSYQVILEITTPYDTHDKPKEPTYKIKKVIRFVPGRPTIQGGLFDPDGS